MGRLLEECQGLLTIHFFDSKQHSRMRLIKRCWECFQGERHVISGGGLQLLELLQLTIRPAEPAGNLGVSLKPLFSESVSGFLHSVCLS